MVEDVGDHSIAVLTVDRAEAHIRRQAGKVVQGLVDQEDARLNEEDLLAQSSEMMGVSCGDRCLPTAARPIHIMHSQTYTPVQKKNPRGLADTSRASPLECWLSRAWA